MEECPGKRKERCCKKENNMKLRKTTSDEKKCITTAFRRGQIYTEKTPQENKKNKLKAYF